MNHLQTSVNKPMDRMSWEEWHEFGPTGKRMHMREMDLPELGQARNQELFQVWVKKMWRTEVPGTTLGGQ